MKLLYCKSCQDVVRPLIGIERTCKCGKSSIVAQLDGITISYTGEQCTIFGIHNPSFIDALHHQPESGQGKDFTAFVLPKKCATAIKRIKSAENLEEGDKTKAHKDFFNKHFNEG